MTRPPRGRTSPPGARYLLTVVVVLLLVQRIALPTGEEQTALTLPVLAVMVAAGVALGHLRLHRQACLLLGVAVSVLAALTALAAVVGREPSLPSLLLLLILYVPAVTVAVDAAAARVTLTRFVDVMACFAVLGLGLFALQFVGVASHDYLADVVPASLLQEGYNTGDAISYGSPYIRSNGVFFLEPSIFSLFLGLAVTVSLGMRHHRGLIPLLLAALACTAAGNGVVVLGVSCLVLAVVGPGRRRLLALAPAVVAAVAFASLTPLAGLFLERSTEVGTQNSSASLRLVQPYEDLVPAIVSTPTDLLVGHGAGSASDYIVERNPTEAVVVPVVAKVAFEYGVLGLLPLLAFLGYVLVYRGRRAVWMPGLALGYFVLNPSLLLATVAAASYLFLSVLVDGVDAPRRRRPAPATVPTGPSSYAAG